MMNRLACLNPFLKYPGWTDYRRVEDHPYEEALTGKLRRKILGPLLGYRWWMFPKIVRRILSRPCSQTLTEQFVSAELSKAGFKSAIWERSALPGSALGCWRCGGFRVDDRDYVFKDGLLFKKQEAIDWLRGVI